MFEQFREAITNLYFSKLRSLLAVLGVLVGTASVVAMVMGGQLATNEALQQFKALGTDLLAVTIIPSNEEDNDPSTGKAVNLSVSQALSLVEVDPSIKAVAPYSQVYQPISYRGEKLSAIMLGVSDSFAPMVKVKLLSGRFISLLDKYNAYCVIGYKIYQQIKKLTYKDPIGQTIQIGKNIFEIVGVADKWQENNFMYINIDNTIMIPMDASLIMSKYAAINNIILRLQPDAPIAQVKDKIRYRLQEYIGNKNFNFRSAEELIAKMKKQSNILTVFLGLIGSISLLVGGIGVMNIMLVSVVERKREIGIRLAVGATPLDISILFLVEAIVLALIGGVSGVALGIGVAYLIALFWHWQFTLFLFPPLAGFTVSVLVGIFFGFYPAYLASKLNPIDALRAE